MHFNVTFTKTYCSQYEGITPQQVASQCANEIARSSVALQSSKTDEVVFVFITVITESCGVTVKQISESGVIKWQKPTHNFTVSEPNTANSLTSIFSHQDDDNNDNDNNNYNNNNNPAGWGCSLVGRALDQHAGGAGSIPR